MPHYSSSIQSDGAYFDIVVFPAESVFNKHKAENTNCPSIKVRALIDTGASISCIDEDEVAKPLSLIARDKIFVSNAGGGGDQYLYDAGFQIPISKTPILPLQVLGASLKYQPYKALIGRDLLKFCNFIYSGTSGFWTISI